MRHIFKPGACVSSSQFTLTGINSLVPAKAFDIVRYSDLSGSKLIMNAFSKQVYWAKYYNYISKKIVIEEINHSHMKELLNHQLFVFNEP